MIPTRLRIVTLTFALAAAVLWSAGAALADPTLVWTDQHDGGDNFVDDGHCVLTDPQGNLVVAGESSDTLRGIDLYVRKLDRTDGHQLWDARYSGYDDKDVAVTDMTWDSVGQLLVAGFIRGCVG
jgi:hypothetical protein